MGELFRDRDAPIVWPPEPFTGVRIRQVLRGTQSGGADGWSKRSGGQYEENEPTNATGDLQA